MKSSKLIKDGIVVINKPKGFSSAKIVSMIKKILNVKKAGHTGTLDPFATGVMVCGINKGTKLSRFLLHERKKYIARLHLGIETDTLDHTGQVVKTLPVDNNEISEEKINDVVCSYKGVQMQTPPVYSALKHNGVPLYKYARNGNPVTKPPREIEIYSIKVIEILLPYIDIEVDCSSGTYIRVLGSDIGDKLGTGAHLASLERIECTGFGIENSFTPEELKKLENPLSALIPMTDAVPHMKNIVADDGLLEKIRFGREIFPEDIEFDSHQAADPIGIIKITDSDNNLSAIIECTQNKINYCCVFHC